MALFDSFPYLENDLILIHRMEASDVDCLEEISWNDNLYRYIPPFLHRKSRSTLLTAIGHLGGREFDNKRQIIAGIYLKTDPGRLVGLTEMFDYRKRTNRMTIGYRVNESYWNRGIASSAVSLMTDYLVGREHVGTLIANVMPENVFSARALVRNGYVKQPVQEDKENWGGRDKAVVDVYAYTAGTNRKE